MAPSEYGDRSHGAAGHSANINDVHIALVKLEGKFDAILKINEAKNEGINSELRLIRESVNAILAAHNRDHGDHENRLRALESRRYVEPRTVWQAVALLTTIAGLVLGVINTATR